MDLSRLKVLNLLTTRMNWLNERQRVLAQNVANADTPDYVARDLAQPDVKALLRQSKGRGSNWYRINIQPSAHRTVKKSQPSDLAPTTVRPK